MAFLYSTYIVIYAIANPLLGKYIDSVYNRTGGSRGGDVHGAVVNIAGVQFTVLTAVVIASTFVPRGALAFNPKMLDDQQLDHDVVAGEDRGNETSMVGTGEIKGMEAVHQTQKGGDDASSEEGEKLKN